jgi:uncharacterized membrane protein YdjX (TVP38/TMEM64 family)
MPLISRNQIYLSLALSALLVSLLVLLLLHFNAHEGILELLGWFERQGIWAGAWFILLMAAVVVLLLPGILFTMGAGFVFGLYAGTVYVVAGTCLGATISFLIARYLFGGRAAAYIRSHARLALVNEEFGAGDWKLVMLTRLIPFFPSKFANYFFGLTGCSLRGFVLGSAIGFIPFSLHSVYLGSIAANIADIGSHTVPRTPLSLALYGLGFVATVVTVWYLNRVAQRAMARYVRMPTGGAC